MAEGVEGTISISFPQPHRNPVLPKLNSAVPPLPQNRLVQSNPATIKQKTEQQMNKDELKSSNVNNDLSDIFAEGTLLNASPASGDTSKHSKPCGPIVDYRTILNQENRINSQDILSQVRRINWSRYTDTLNNRNDC